jgi:hypothetical protein
MAAVVFFLSVAVAAQEASLEWEKTFTTSRSNAAGNSVQAKADGGFVSAGRTNSTVFYPGAAPRSDVYLVSIHKPAFLSWPVRQRTHGVESNEAGSISEEW